MGEAHAPGEAAMSVFDQVCQFLDGRSISYTVLRHAPVFTSEEAAAVRGTSLGSGAKALVCKADERFLMIVLPADRKLASKAFRSSAGIKSLRFASREEVETITGLAPGSIPPFGSLFGLPTWCDERLGEHPQINFNAGDHTISISMTYANYLAAEQPQLGRYAE
jgi:Ala-tRNA(Pro) deacylase